MALTKYSFSISNDFPNGVLAADSLDKEIRMSSISIALDSINVVGDTCDIWFKAILPPSDITALNYVIANHKGTPLFSVEKVEVINALKSVHSNIHNKIEVHETSRIPGTRTYYTGAGDDPKNILDVGGGTHFVLRHRIGDPLVQYLYLDFNVIENETWLHEGYVIWHGAKFDSITFEIVPRTVSGTYGENTFYNIYNGFLVVPAAGDGTFQLLSDITLPHGGLIYMPPDYDGLRSVPCFWNAKWNSISKKYENISPAPLGDGNFNMFTSEVSLSRFVNRLPLVEFGFQMMQSADSELLGQGMRLRARMDTIYPDHDWTVACILTLHRARSV